MNYFYDEFKNSRHVSPGYPQCPISNIYGQYWKSLGSVIYGLSEIRPRMGSLPTPWGAESDKLFVPPKLITIQDTLSDLLDVRAIELNKIAQNSNKKIVILWSGGIDSTTVVAAFIKNLSQQDLKNIVICMTLGSVLENLQFYRDHITPNFECISFFNLDVTNDFLEHNILLHGDPGDCLFGPSISMYEQMIPDQSHLKPWKDNLDSIIASIDIRAKKAKEMPEGFGHWYVEKITNNLLEVQPPGIDSVADWWWWHYFNFKWEFSVWRPFFKMRKDTSQTLDLGLIESYVENTFLNTKKFQLWSYNNLKTHVGTSVQDHKMQAKQYIFELDKNRQYFDHKTKVDSSPKYWSSRVRLPMYYDQNWKGHFMTVPGVTETAIELLENYKG
jgi:hypothetical protein